MSTLPRIEHVSYGPDPEQRGELWLPEGTPEPWPVTVLLHGGFWRAPFTLELMRPLAQDLTRRGQAVWNLEYRRVGCPGGGWPGTLADVALGIDALAGMSRTWPLALDRVVLVGHSAGGQMALWAAGRGSLEAQDPQVQGLEAQAVLLPAYVVSLAGLSDLESAAQQSLGEGATDAFLGGSPQDRPEAFRHASPSARLPIGVPQLLVHGDADPRVPISMTQRYAAAATAAGDDVETLLYEGVNHLDLIDPASAAWSDVVARAWP